MTPSRKTISPAYARDLWFVFGGEPPSIGYGIKPYNSGSLLYENREPIGTVETAIWSGDDAMWIIHFKELDC